MIGFVRKVDHGADIDFKSSGDGRVAIVTNFNDLGSFEDLEFMLGVVLLLLRVAKFQKSCLSM